MTAKSTDLATLAAAVEDARQRAEAIGGERVAAVRRLEELPAEIAEGIANADGRLVGELRQERTACEATVRDSEGAERLVLSELEQAESELAVVQLPERTAQAERARDSLEALVGQVGDRVQTYLAAHREYLHVRNRAQPGDDQRAGAIRTRTPEALAVLRLWRDSFNS